MILRRLRVHPFGRFVDREVSFGPLLTVVLGPNETGKSTLLEAVKAALFVPAKLSKPKFQEYLARFVPVDGGDVVRVEVCFLADGGEYAIARRWGAGAASELRQPRGGPLTDEKAIQERVAGLLPVSPKTLVTVLVVGQSDLGDTVAALGGTGALDDVAAMLRRVVQETGGVSVDLVRRTLAEAAAKLYGRWDRQRGAPERGRGIENPWDRGVGELLAAWYAAEHRRSDLEKARAFERDLDALNRRIEAAEGSLRDRERFLAENAAAHRDALERRTFEAQLALEREQQARIARDADDWPVCEAKEKELSGAIARAEARIPGLVEEQKAAEAEGRNLSLREQAARVARRKGELIAAEAALEAARKLDGAALAEIRAADRDLERLRAAGASRAIALRFDARRPVKVGLRQPGGPASTVELGPGESRTVETGPVFSLGLPDLDVAVSPGGGPGRGDPVEAARKLASLLDAHGIADVGAAEASCREYEGRLAESDRARRELAVELAGEPLEAFEARTASLGEARPTRAASEVARELAGLEAGLVSWRKERQERLERIASLEAAYGARGRLHAQLGESLRRRAEIEARIAAFIPLPQGFPDAASLLVAYDEAKTARDADKDALNALIQERIGREAAAPDQSVEELEGQHRDASARFDAALCRARAVDRVIAAVERVAASDDGVYAGLADEVARRFAGLTLGAHPGLAMRGGLPSAVKTASGAELPWGWLSAGAKDLLGLAVRLAMAGVAIGASGGFLLMDDPLVDLDPERQAAAAGAIREFAASRQTVVFTCHPAHAELLGGELVRLE